MKKIVYFLLIGCFFMACDDTNQSKTSYILGVAIGDDYNFVGVKTAYFDENGKCILLDEIGNMIPHDYSREYFLPEFHPEVHVFTDYAGGLKVDTVFVLTEGIKNRIIIDETMNLIPVANKNESNWPH
ncbi:MAG: hypothetical protein LBH12_02255 [Dysgonamonadaceae bacterium]|nr:hypothetical protein [Dysgonamonadaceae bacterium]